MRHLLATLAGLRFLPARWQLPGFVALGVTFGMGGLVFHISRAASYLSDSPETCANCHVMAPQYLTWQHSSHAPHTTCNDCHTPHQNLLAQYAFKAKDGLWHATVFTMRWEPQVIRLSSGAVPVVEQNCRRCHSQALEQTALNAHQQGDLRCWDCHRDVPHGLGHNLAGTPSVFRPQLPDVGRFRQQPTIAGRKPRRQ